MKQHWIDYQETRPVCPMTCWVHREADGKPWHSAERFEPSRQPVVPGWGYPIFRVECDGFLFEFSSLAELRELIGTFEQKVLPRSSDRARERGLGMGPNSHWLSRLPGRGKSWRYREKALAYLRRSLEDFERTLA